MDELIGRLVANIGIDQATAQKAVGIILQFLLKEGPAEKVQDLLAKLPGALEAIAAAPPDEGTGMFGGGVLAAGTRMMSVGLSMGQVQAVTRETIGYAREKVGEETLGEIAGAIPGLVVTMLFWMARPGAFDRHLRRTLIGVTVSGAASVALLPLLIPSF